MQVLHIHANKSNDLNTYTYLSIYMVENHNDWDRSSIHKIIKSLNGKTLHHWNQMKIKVLSNVYWESYGKMSKVIISREIVSPPAWIELREPKERSANEPTMKEHKTTCKIHSSICLREVPNLLPHITQLAPSTESSSIGHHLCNSF